MVLTFEKGNHKTYHYKPNLSFANSGECLILHFNLKQLKTFNLARFLRKRTKLFGFHFPSASDTLILENGAFKFIVIVPT